MACIAMTKSSFSLYQCARMILRDECPPCREYYLCMVEEDDTVFDCTQCWDAFLQGIAAGTIELPKEDRRFRV